MKKLYFLFVFLQTLPFLILAYEYDPRSFATDQSYQTPLVTDINNDQSPDLIICNSTTKEIEIWEFIDNSLTKTDAITGFAYKAHNIACGDFDKDGDIDIVSTHRSNGLFVSFNEENGWNTQQMAPTDGKSLLKTSIMMEIWIFLTE